MGWQFRRSVNLGPFRVNLSKHGVGYSVGAAGFRTGKSATGRKYKSFNVPGTGLTYKTTGGKAAGGMPGCAVVLVSGLALAAAGGAAAWKLLS